MSRKYAHLKSKYADKTPVIVTGLSGAPRKYLVPEAFTISELVSLVRSRQAIDPQKSLYVTIKGTLPTASDPLSLYENGDIVHVTFHVENTFGCKIL